MQHTYDANVYVYTIMCMCISCCWFYNKQNKMWLFDLLKYLKYKICKGDKLSTAFHILTTFTTTDANPTCRLSFIVWPPEALNFQLYACYFLIIVASYLFFLKRKENHTIFRDTTLLLRISYTPWTLKEIHEIIRKLFGMGNMSTSYPSFSLLKRTNLN